MSASTKPPPAADPEVVRDAKRQLVERLVGFVTDEALAVALADVDAAFEGYPALLALEIIPVRGEGGGPTGAWVAPITLPEQLDAVRARNEAALRRAMGVFDEVPTAGSRSCAQVMATVAYGRGAM